MKKEIIIVKNDNKIIKEMDLEECTIFFEGAIKRWANEVFVTLKGMSNNLMEYDDFYSEGMLCLVKTYKEYKPINSFNTNLHKSLDNLKIDWIRNTNAQKRKTEQSVVSFDMELEDEECDFLQEIEGSIDENFAMMEFNEDITNAIARLTNEEKRIVDYLLENECTKRVLAKELNISRPTLDTRIEKVKDKVIDLLPEYILY